MTPAASGSCTRCGCRFWWPLIPLGQTYPVVGVGVAAIAVMWIVAFGRPIWLVYAISSDDVVQVAMFGSLLFLAELGAAGLVIAWLWRAMTNIEAFPGRDGMGAAWAIGAWFVPAANLVLPMRVMWQVAGEELTGRWVKPALWLWWISYTASYLVAFLGLNEYEHSLRTSIASTITLGIAAIALGELILAISRAQQGRVDQAIARRAVTAGPAMSKLDP